MERAPLATGSEKVSTGRQAATPPIRQAHSRIAQSAASGSSLNTASTKSGAARARRCLPPASAGTPERRMAPVFRVLDARFLVTEHPFFLARTHVPTVPRSPYPGGGQDDEGSNTEGRRAPKVPLTSQCPLHDAPQAVVFSQTPPAATRPIGHRAQAGSRIARQRDP